LKQAIRSGKCKAESDQPEEVLAILLPVAWVDFCMWREGRVDQSSKGVHWEVRLDFTSYVFQTLEGLV
jgi:hypothetical protein